MPKSKHVSAHRRAGSVKILSGEDGNTRPSPSIHWCFTLFNYTEADIANILQVGTNGSKKLYFQEERCPTSGRDHLQGYIAFKKKCRPIGMFDNRTINWQKANNWRSARLYPLKDDTRFGRRWTLLDGKIPTVRTYRPLLPEPFPWQQEIIDMCKKQPDKRKIHWYWEATGAAGKTTLTKYIVKNFNALMISGKASDMKCAIAKKYKKTGSGYDVVILNVPRCVNSKFISYTGIEEIKNGLFFSGKYESTMVMTDHPHMIVFANEPPDKSKMSMDRWCIKNVGDTPHTPKNEH